MIWPDILSNQMSFEVSGGQQRAQKGARLPVRPDFFLSLFL
jgi:hypothetical protein